MAAAPQKSKPKQSREIMDRRLNKKDDFLTHHLKYELSLTKLVNTQRIARRQLVEHFYLQDQWNNVGRVGEKEIVYQTYK